MAHRPGDGPPPTLPRFRALVPLGLTVRQAVETILMKVCCSDMLSLSSAKRRRAMSAFTITAFTKEHTTTFFLPIQKHCSTLLSKLAKEVVDVLGERKASAGRALTH